MSFTIFHDVHINSTKEKLFASITEAAHLINWWPLKATSHVELNGVYNFYFTEEYDWFGKVVALEKQDLISIEMTKSDEDWDGTILTYELEQKENGINLKFSHRGWKVVNHHYRRTSWCWAVLLLGLKNYVERGEVVAFGERA